ncbi:MAG: esterase-like activity of phytase family protein [Chloroflexi bacterium]|nr:esterase-like activity of phytase family protein [Chloroflexota bacterium]
MLRVTLIGLVLALACLFWPWNVGAQAGPLRLLGQYSFESKRTFQDTTVGGLSGLTFDAKRGVFYAICDDRGENQSPRFYTLQIDFDDSGIKDVRVVGVTFLDSDAQTPGIQPYERNDSDLEEIILLADDTLIVSSERDRDGKPWIRRFGLDGSLLGELPVPSRFVTVAEPGPDGRPRVTKGVRGNLGFEGVAITPSQQTLFLANEEALAQDGPIATTTAGTNVRILRMELYGAEGRSTAEYVYPVEKVYATPVPADQFGDNGVSAMMWVRDLLPEYDLLVMERSFATGVGNDVNIYGVTLEDATDVRDVDALPNPYNGRYAKKTLLVNMTAIGVAADNLEGLALGPRLPNGKPSLIVMSDDNFSAFDPPQINQFLLFEIDTNR